MTISIECLTILGWSSVFLAGIIIVLLGFWRSPYSVDASIRALARKRVCKLGADTQQETVCVIGAGISGLYTAYKLREHCQVVVVEGSGAPGGNNRSSPVASTEVPVQYGCSGWTTSPTLTNLVEELGLHRQECRQHVAALVDGSLELKRFDSAFPSSSPHSRCRLFAWARSYPVIEQFRFLIWWIWAHLLYYIFPLQTWSATDVLLSRNTGIDDILIPQGGINVFVDRCDLDRCPYTYFLRYAALYLGRKFFCIKEGNHALIRSLYAKICSDCQFHFNSRVSSVAGQEGSFFVHLESGISLGPFHQVIMACQPHQVPRMLPSGDCYKTHRECGNHFESTVARSAVHTDPTPFEKADDSILELGIMYDRTLGEKPHHYLHINPAQFYHIDDLPEHTFVTVSYDDAHPENVIAKGSILNSYQTTLSRLKAGSQQELPRLIHKLHNESHGIHLASAALLGLMWHEDGLTMGELAYQACLVNLQRKPTISSKEAKEEATTEFVASMYPSVDKPLSLDDLSPETTIDTSDACSDFEQSSDDPASVDQLV